MKVAAITITYNDDYKFNEWYQHYNEYKNDLYMHIIVDNGSDKNYIDKTKKFFSGSIIIERKTNGGCTNAYNDGIKYALNDPNVDAIMLIGNDMKLSDGAVPKLFEFLNSNSRYGMVAPILLEKDSNIVESFGCKINIMLMKLVHLGYGDNISNIKETFHIVDAVAGGMNLARREFYEQVGLQDPDLFMYYDEVDMGIRAKKAGFKMAATKEVISWHQHINPHQKKFRSLTCFYLIGRNNIYLAGKHFGFFIKLITFGYNFCLSFLKIIKWFFLNRKVMIYHLYFNKGAFNGFIGNMDLSGIIMDI
jgi:GT2 family glycosyltransferase